MLQTSLLSLEALSPALICCILSFDVCILPEELVCHKNSQIHMWSFLMPDQLFPLKSRRNTSVWPLKQLEKQWKGLQHRHKAFTVADARDAKRQAYLCLGRQERQGFNHLFKAPPFVDFPTSLLHACISCSSSKLGSAISQTWPQLHQLSVIIT